MEKLSGNEGRNVLYNRINDKLTELGITDNDYPIHSSKILSMFYPEIELQYWEFSSSAICGILYLGDVLSTVILNKKRDIKGQNFDLMHELVHYWFHPKHDGMCIYDDKILRRTGREWQANEGAAQALMPEDLFIRKFYEVDGDLNKLSDMFFVGRWAVNFRINNLKKKIIKAESIYKPKKAKKDLISSFAPWKIEI